MTMSDSFDPSYDDLSSAWWLISEALELKTNPWKNEQHNRVFCELLRQCGWTLERWNDAVDVRKKKLEDETEQLSPDMLIDEDPDSSE